MRLLIIRHGDPDYEHDALTAAGEKEAQLLADWLSARFRPAVTAKKSAGKPAITAENFGKNPDSPDLRIPVHAIYESPLGRARRTAEYTLKALGMTAETCPWLREFDAKIRRPDKDTPTIAWDWLPQDLCPVDDFYGESTWMNPAPMAESDIREKYQAVCQGVDELLSRHGYLREGRFYRAEKPNHDCIFLFCHFGVESVILSHLLNCSPMPLWHGFCALPTSVTTVFTEERRQGIASFRVSEYGSLAHLHAAGQEPSFSARFCECWADETRHD